MAGAGRIPGPPEVSIEKSGDRTGQHREALKAAKEHGIADPSEMFRGLIWAAYEDVFSTRPSKRREFLEDLADVTSGRFRSPDPHALLRFPVGAFFKPRFPKRTNRSSIRADSAAAMRWSIVSECPL